MKRGKDSAQTATELGQHGITRRKAVALGAIGAVAMVSGGASSCDPNKGADLSREKETQKEVQMNERDQDRARMPVAYLPHGGGPFSFVEMGNAPAEVEAMVDYWRALGAAPAEKPKALLVISAHWEEEKPTVLSGERPPILYDYYGFPPASYQIEWPAPGAPKLARHVRDLLEAAGMPSASDEQRGFDHGTFIPLKRSFPLADIPTLQLSLQKGLDPQQHLRIGQALQPLREEGVYILGSGMSYHNMRGFGSGAPGAKTFDAWLQASLTRSPKERNEALIAWPSAPEARRVHPREEHLLPLMVCAGAAGDDIGRVAFSGFAFGAKVSGFSFG